MDKIILWKLELYTFYFAIPCGDVFAVPLVYVLWFVHGFTPGVYRESQQNFEEVHSRLKRGDIVGVKGKPGMWVGQAREVGFISLIWDLWNTGIQLALNVVQQLV